MIYIHVPFCRRKCNYCAFNSAVGDDAEKISYVEALTREIELRADFSQVESIYFGGGTPTTLTLAQLEKIFDALTKNFSVDERAEITIEANPSTVDENFLRGLKSIGFNRLSLGVQSFDDALLKILGRIHDSRTALETVALAEKFFDNVSIDLMYGLPTQTLEILSRDVARVKNLGIQHVSIYGLEVERGTKFFSDGVTVDENLCADMYDFITETLPTFGFRRYEISNFAAKNFESRHNLGYWTGKKYFGFGAGAHGFDGKIRTSNVCDTATYIQKIFAGEDVSEVEEIVTRQAAMEEFCFLGLRVVEGISAKTFAKNFGAQIFDVFGSVIEKNQRLGLLEVDGDKIFLTKRGMALGNEVFADFLF
ncbi:MAG: radical SAM family heme chaperone HemW [Selenomonadaceae bacterium]|nr:radical SAM family heme chaperone HemW [Selenomonadaceae bacterium]